MERNLRQRFSPTFDFQLCELVHFLTNKANLKSVTMLLAAKSNLIDEDNNNMYQAQFLAARIQRERRNMSNFNEINLNIRAMINKA